MAAVPLKSRALAVLWPAFLMAGVLEGLVFALVDPAGLHGFGGAPIRLASEGVYTVAFLVFWAVIACASALTQWLALDADAVNRAG